MPVTANNFGVQDFAFPVVSSSGTCDYPAASDVQEGVSYDSGGQVGTFARPAEADVRSGILYGHAGEFVGTLTLPSSGEPSETYECYSPADVSRRVLIAMGHGLDPPSTPWPIYCEGEPNLPDEVITVYDTTARDDGRSQVTGERFFHYGIQVRVRSRVHAMGWDKACAIREAMDEDAFDKLVTLGGVPYLVRNFSNVGGVLRLGNESPTSKRKLFTINAMVVMEILT